ncbi:hypothetical protein, partial [Okeania sp. SIO3B5]|uniref:hypothetical protein n=1 Tax=Okeania sp. SIO3B5 TaxID=2607811 RepID=UPI0025EADB01
IKNKINYRTEIINSSPPLLGGARGGLGGGGARGGFPTPYSLLPTPSFLEMSNNLLLSHETAVEA